MGIETAEDRQAMIEVFGDPATVGGVTIIGIYDDPHFSSLEMSTSTPMLTYVTVDLPAIAFGQTVSVPSVGFSGQVKDIQHDGSGFTTLMLKV